MHLRRKAECIGAYRCQYSIGARQQRLEIEITRSMWRCKKNVSWARVLFEPKLSLFDRIGVFGFLRVCCAVCSHSLVGGCSGALIGFQYLGNLDMT